MYTINNIVNDVDRKLHTGGASQTQDFYGALDEARRNMIGKITPPELIRSAYLEQALYDQINKYAVAPDLKYEDIVDIKMLSAYRNLDTECQVLKQVYRRQFDQKRRANIVQIGWENGIKYMRIFEPTGLTKDQHLLVHDADSLTDNGTWNVGGNLVNLRLDYLNYLTGSASLKFDLNNSGTTGFLENFTMDPVDLYDFLNTGAVFTWLNITAFREMTSVRITMGSNLGNLNTDLYRFTVNQPHDNNQFTDGWNLLKFAFQDIQTVGTPNPRAIAYLRFDFTTTGQAILGCNMDNVIARRGKVYEMVYNSRFCIIDATTYAWKQFGSATTDILPLEEDTYQILMLETALVIQKEAYGNNAGAKADVNDIGNELAIKYAEYKKKHKAEIIIEEQNTNRFGRFNYGYYGGYNNRGNDDYLDRP